MTDAIALVEQAYALDRPLGAWLASLARALRDAVGRTRGVLAFTYRIGRRGEVDPQAVASAGMSAAIRDAVLGMVKAAPAPIVARVHAHGVHDHDCVVASTVAEPGGSGLTVGISLGPLEPTPAVLRPLWDRIASHLAAGLRLREALGGAAPPPARARDRLRDAAVRMEGPRAGREAPAEALALWRGLIAGRWSLVDHFERSGRRYVVAHRNPPGVRDPRGLTAREREVVWHASLGRANKLIAHELGVTTSAVAMALARATAKLGVASRAELIVLARGLGGRPR